MDRTVSQPDLLVAEALSVGHGTAPVCAPVDLRLAAGRAVAVVGPNGSGKSTLLRTLVGLLEPLDGTVAFAGAPVDERSAAFRRDVAAVLDDDAFFVSLTGREHLLLTARGHGVAAAEEVVDAEVEAFGLGERADALPSELSSGQRLEQVDERAQQRGLARAVRPDDGQCAPAGQPQVHRGAHRGRPVPHEEVLGDEQVGLTRGAVHQPRT